jgi:hypothetical protein
MGAFEPLGQFPVGHRSKQFDFRACPAAMSAGRVGDFQFLSFLKDGPASPPNAARNFPIRRLAEQSQLLRRPARIPQHRRDSQLLAFMNDGQTSAANALRCLAVRASAKQFQFPFLPEIRRSPFVVSATSVMWRRLSTRQ